MQDNITVEKSILALTEGPLKPIAVRNMDDISLLNQWCMLDIMEKSFVKERKEVLKDELLERAKTKGALNEKGGYDWSPIEGSSVKMSLRKKKDTFEPALIKKRLGDKFSVSEQVLKRIITLTEVQYVILSRILDRSEDEDAVEIQAALGSAKVDANIAALNGLHSQGLLSQEDMEMVTNKGETSRALLVTKPKALKQIQAQIKKQTQIIEG